MVPVENTSPPTPVSASRIVSLVPSATETLFALGAGDHVVGVTRFCVHPPRARQSARVIGGTKNPSVERILSLEPDLVVANQEENRKEDIERLEKHVRVHVAFPRSIAQAVADIRSLGALVGRAEQAKVLADGIEETRGRFQPVPTFRYLYFVWRRPYMVAGRDTFIHAVLEEAGGANAAPTDRGRYPELTPEDIETSGAQVLLLSTEPFPFREEHGAELLSHLRNANRFRDRVLVVDGELLSWHGARLREGLPYLARISERISKLASHPE